MTCPICKGYGELLGIFGRFGAYRCESCGGTFHREETPDWSDTSDIEDGFTLPSRIDADHSLTTEE